MHVAGHLKRFVRVVCSKFDGAFGCIYAEIAAFHARILSLHFCTFLAIFHSAVLGASRMRYLFVHTSTYLRLIHGILCFIALFSNECAASLWFSFFFVIFIVPNRQLNQWTTNNKTRDQLKSDAFLNGAHFT